MEKQAQCTLTGRLWVTDEVCCLSLVVISVSGLSVNSWNNPEGLWLIDSMEDNCGVEVRKWRLFGSSVGCCPNSCVVLEEYEPVISMNLSL